jgi:hypothetical protein
MISEVDLEFRFHKTFFCGYSEAKPESHAMITLKRYFRIPYRSSSVLLSPYAYANRFVSLSVLLLTFKPVALNVFGIVTP